MSQLRFEGTVAFYTRTHVGRTNPWEIVTVSDIDFEQRENYEFRVAVIDKTCVKKLGP